MDEIDWQIIGHLQDDGRLSFRQLADRVHLSPAAATARVHALEEQGVITGYRAVIDPAVAGRSVEAIVRLVGNGSTTRSIAKATEIARRHPAVRRMHQVLGDCDAIFHVDAASLQELDQLVTALGDYGRTTTALVVDSPVEDKPVTGEG
jgi:Lrp/AsnC family leucine-responsive transcriptional regulator